MKDDPLSVQGEALIKNAYPAASLKRSKRYYKQHNCETSSRVLSLSPSQMEIIDMNPSFEVTLSTQ